MNVRPPLGVRGNMDTSLRDGRKRTWSFVIAAMAMSLASVAAAAELPADLSSGAIVATTRAHEGTNVRWGRSTGVVDASIDDVMKVVSNYGAYHEFMPHFEASKVLSQRGERALVYMEALIAKNTLKVWAQLKITPEHHDNIRVVSARMTKGNLSHMEARWEVSPLPDGRTLVTFDLLVDPKLPLPSSLVSSENEKASKRTIRALRDRLAARGR